MRPDLGEPQLGADVKQDRKLDVFDSRRLIPGSKACARPGRARRAAAGKRQPRRRRSARRRTSPPTRPPPRPAPLPVRRRCGPGDRGSRHGNGSRPRPPEARRGRGSAAPLRHRSQAALELVDEQERARKQRPDHAFAALGGQECAIAPGKLRELRDRLTWLTVQRALDRQMRDSHTLGREWDRVPHVPASSLRARVRAVATRVRTSRPRCRRLRARRPVLSPARRVSSSAAASTSAASA